MQIRRFEGKDMHEALRRVREDLGPDALVLSTRTLKKGRGAFGRFARSIVEITAAIDPDVRRQSEVAQPNAPVERDRGRPDPSWSELRLTQALIQPLEKEIQELRGSLDRVARGQDAMVAQDLRDEIAALRRVALDLGAAQRAPQTDESPREAALRRLGLARRHRAPLAVADSNQRIELLARMLDDALSPPRPENDRITIYTGPAGVGKTTTLAKVAGRAEIEAMDAAVLSTDVHRLAAEAPLKAWAKSRSVAFESAVSSESVASAVSRLGRRPIFIDTPGCGRSDADSIQELAGLRDKLGERAQICLVLPATHKESDLREEIERFAVVSPESMVLTHVDESRDLGNVANLLLDGICPPLHWIATGQRVPTDLAIADPDDLAHRILGDAA